MSEYDYVDCGNGYETFAARLVKVEKIGHSRVRLCFANPDGPRRTAEKQCFVIHLKVVIEEAALPEIIRALMNVDRGEGMKTDDWEGRRLHS